MASERCANCGEQIKSGMLGSNRAFNDKQLFALRQIRGEDLAAACEHCGDSLLALPHTLGSAVSATQRDLLAVVNLVPLVSIHSPQGWEFDTLGLVTGQSTTGTGMFSDVASALTDLFGAQSKTYNSKLRHGESICKTALRMQAIELGGNAVLGVDVDYAEVGGQRAMLMVCMTGTAVRMKNVAVVEPDITDIAQRIRTLNDKLDQLQLAQKGVSF
jgi:uncharacterized protein YbjQ (UPF0145 family)